MLDTEHFASGKAVGGPLLSQPFDPVGGDIAPQVTANRSKIPFANVPLSADHHGS